MKYDGIFPYSAVLVIYDSESEVYDSGPIRCRGEHELQENDGVVDIIAARCFRKILNDCKPAEIKRANLVVGGDKSINVMACDCIRLFNEAQTDLRLTNETQKNEETPSGSLFLKLDPEKGIDVVDLGLTRDPRITNDGFLVGALQERLIENKALMRVLDRLEENESKQKGEQDD